MNKKHGVLRVPKAPNGSSEDSLLSLQCEEVSFSPFTLFQFEQKVLKGKARLQEKNSEPIFHPSGLWHFDA